MADLSNIKVGGKLLVSTWCRDFLATVTRITKTQVICGVDKFRKIDGNGVGNSYKSARPITNE